MNLLLGLYIGEILLNLILEAICEIRYKKLKKELGYINIRESELSKTFSDSPILTSIVFSFVYLFPFSFISSIKKNINFKYDSLDAIKDELDKGIIKLRDEDELHPIELIYKIKGARKSLAASYLEYLEELALQEEAKKDIQANNVFEADKSDYENKQEELKKLQLKFDNIMRNDYEVATDDDDDI